MIESNKVESPHVTLDFDGGVSLWTDMVVVSTCAMEVYKFPFEVQSCKLTFKSTILTEDEMRLIYFDDTKWRIEWSLKKMTQSEWLLTNLTMSKEIVDNFYSDLPVVVYT
ncbi:5-hydroxytryptamine receptor 3B-like, partial [Anarrhichthys ocellatus]|uniref:5-hydroxytryptamine receptor 3B-like n=1 Tax=Anarrhichthys ocellatus TaxID=433405 RepID=UPI0012ED5E38